MECERMEKEVSTASVHDCPLAADTRLPFSQTCLLPFQFDLQMMSGSAFWKTPIASDVLNPVEPDV